MFVLSSLNRFSAAAWHLLGSAIIASLSALLVFTLWYPGAFANASGVSEIFLILVGVDIVLGPVITLIIFNPLKKELRRDLLIVVFVQLAALFYGVYSVFIARPAFVVFNADRFDLVYANEISQDKFSKASYPEYSAAPLFGPKFVAARLPEDESKAQSIILDAITGGDDIQNYPEYFQPLKDVKEELCAEGLPLEALKERNLNETEAEQLLERYGDAQTKVAYLPMFAKRKDVSVIVDLKSGEVLEVVSLRPF